MTSENSTLEDEHSEVSQESAEVEAKSNGSGIDGRLVKTDTPRSEVSASTVGMMLGLATSKDLQLLESKIDLMATKISNMGARLERFATTLQHIPTGSDLERIDVQIASLRSLIKEVLVDKLADSSASEPGAKKLGKTIVSSEAPQDAEPSGESASDSE